MMSLAEIRLAMTATLFLIGVVASISGLWIIMAKEYQSAMRQLANQSIRINGRAVTQEDVAPVIDSAARLVEAISQLIRTAAGIGAFLCVMGVGICVVAFWLTTRL
jgi:hypothetical protein